MPRQRPLSGDSPYISQVSAMVDPRCVRVRLSRELPSWLWSLLAHSLSIMPETGRARSRLIVGTTLYVLTLTATIVFLSSSGFYTFFDILSEATKSTVFTGTADILLGLSWASIGTYANHLAYRVLTTRALSSNIRLHTRKVLRMNTGLLIFIMAVGGVGAHFYHYADQIKARECKQVGLYPFVCKIRYVSGCIYGGLAVFWNLIVAWSILSVCRTHTIAARRFVRELEFEGKVLEKIYSLRLVERAQQLVPGAATDVTWDEVLPSDFMNDVEPREETATRQYTTPVTNGDELPSVGIVEPSQELLVILGDSHNVPSTTASSNTSTPPASEAEAQSPSAVNIPQMFLRLEADRNTDVEAYRKLLFTCEDVCMRYWRIGCQLRITSLIFQRWMATWLSFTAIWALSYIVHWLNHKASLLDLLDFFVPVLLIGLVCSSYAEVNLECARINESVCPHPDRLYFNRFLASQPTYMSIYSQPMTYQVIAGFVAAFAIAFLSRIVMDEFDKS